MSSLNATTLASIREYLGLDSRAARRLAAFRPLAAAHFDRVVDDFYDAIQAHPEARAVLTCGPSQLARLKVTLKAWLESLLAGTYDAAYLKAHSRIGRVHVRIGLPQHLMFTAMSRVRAGLVAAAEQVYAEDVAARAAVTSALHRLLDMELAIMLDSYREVLVERQRTQERLATIGELAGSVAHELRNPLGTMESSLFLIKRRLGELGVHDEVLAKHHDKALRQVSLCNDTIGRLLDLAQDRPPRSKHIEVRPWLEETVATMRLGERVRVTLQIPSGLRFFADPTQLALVVANLLRNAAEASPDGVSVTMSAKAERGGVSLVVADDGPGVAEHARDRLFDALFTTRSQGTGLGLALAARIVQAHGGEIALMPSEKGAVFGIWLPGPVDPRLSS